MAQDIFAWIIIVLGVVLLILGAALIYRQFKLANQVPDAAGLQATDTATWDGLAKLLEALSKLPAGDRLIFYGIVLVMIGGVVGGWIDLSVITVDSKTS